MGTRHFASNGELDGKPGLVPSGERLKAIARLWHERSSRCVRDRASWSLSMDSMAQASHISPMRLRRTLAPRSAVLSCKSALMAFTIPAAFAGRRDLARRGSIVAPTDTQTSAAAWSSRWAAASQSCRRSGMSPATSRSPQTRSWSRLAAWCSSTGSSCTGPSSEISGTQRSGSTCPSRSACRAGTRGSQARMIPTLKPRRTPATSGGSVFTCRRPTLDPTRPGFSTTPTLRNRSCEEGMGEAPLRRSQPTDSHRVRR